MKVSDPRYVQPSIRTETIFPYLDRTADEHNGFGGEVYDKLVYANVNSTGRARAFGVSNHTNAKWESIYYDEGHGPKDWRKKMSARIARKNKLKK